MIIGLFAVDGAGGMGANNDLPWPHNPDDMRWFKKTTEGQVVIMGRRTWESEGMPKPLPKRHNVVFTNTFMDREDIIQVRGNVADGIRYIQQRFEKEDVDIFVIGGPNLLIQAREVMDKVYVTRIPGEYFCDCVIDIDQFLSRFDLVHIHDLGSCTVEEYEAI